MLVLYVMPSPLALLSLLDLLALASYCTLALSLALALSYILPLCFVIIVAVVVVLSGMLALSCENKCGQHINQQEFILYLLLIHVFYMGAWPVCRHSAVILGELPW